tara:strand:+ start:5408 stop:6334 length:927 start_codon:yes stop_codon:yes gene_type:complete
MDNIFLDEDIEMNEKNYVNENNIIDRNTSLVQCEDNQRNLYDIDKLIVKDVYRENILLSNKDTDDTVHDSKTIRFNLSNNKAGGIQFKKNVIGFRLNECIYTSPVFNISNDTDITYNVESSSTIQIVKGFYTIFSLLSAINTNSNNDSFTLDFDSSKSLVVLSFKTSIEHVTFNGVTENSLIYNLGFRPDSDDVTILSINNDNNNKTALTHPSLIIGTYIDIVVDEIPYKACKQNPQGLNIVHRLPVRPDTGSSIVYYKSNFIDHNFQYLFYPINLNTLTIHLYMDGVELNLEHMTISFEFELVILNK